MIRTHINSFEAEFHFTYETKQKHFPLINTQHDTCNYCCDKWQSNLSRYLHIHRLIFSTLRSSNRSFVLFTFFDTTRCPLPRQSGVLLKKSKLEAVRTRTLITNVRNWGVVENWPMSMSFRSMHSAINFSIDCDLENFIFKLCVHCNTFCRYWKQIGAI